ncbi:cation diffusion facilitator family transporter [Salicola sp. Rm-C-2C1-2]|uniref:cation diffusion facilitator family transporter n=1 Tax=Salicola sp. Rm-C-2C1-2 TaxID=3141321 RepID=UPI0032E52EB8
MDHNHDHSAGDQRVGIAIVSNFLLTLAQIGGGILSGSLALIGDALHNFSDMASMVIALMARRIARRPADPAMTFGYGRVETVAALVNYTTLILIGLYLAFEGIMRILDPTEVAGMPVILLGLLALVVDTLTAVLTGSIREGGSNIRALFLHNLSDALTSVAVVVSGVLILLYDWRLVDPLITLLIAGYIFWLSATEIGGVIRVLMLGSPPEIDTEAVLDCIREFNGVRDIHHAHFWLMEENAASLDTHVVVTTDAWPEQQTLKERIREALASRFGIQHTTLELEPEDQRHEGATLYGCP